jgi:hypothetical protein
MRSSITRDRPEALRLSTLGRRLTECTGTNVTHTLPERSHGRFPRADLGGARCAQGRAARTAGIARDPSTSQTCAERLQIRLFFGLRTSAGTVSDDEWGRFLADVVTPRFPRGLTVGRADGQWRAPGDAHVTQEPSLLVAIYRR